jgi:hypothetical protein
MILKAGSEKVPNMDPYNFTFPSSTSYNLKKYVSRTSACLRLCVLNFLITSQTLEIMGRLGLDDPPRRNLSSGGTLHDFLPSFPSASPQLMEGAHYL